MDDSIEYDKLFIGGSWHTPSSDARIEVTSPTTEERIGSTPEATHADADAAIGAAGKASAAPDGWPTWEAKRRAEILDRLADVYERRSEELAQRVSMQNGMPIGLARLFEAGFPPAVFRYYAGLLRRRPSIEERDGMFGGKVLVERRAVGVVVAIVPWNYPQTLTSMKLGPALAAGCSIVLKPSPETVLDAYLLAECVEEAGVPPGVVSILPGGRELGAYLVGHAEVDKVAFTGSTAAGRQIAETCGRLLRPVTLELGGKSAAIVLEDADLSDASERLFAATLLHGGQTCFLCTRVLAPRSRYDEVVDVFAALASAAKVGDPLDGSTQVGPMVSAHHRERVEAYVAKGRQEGARLVVGGGRPKHLEKGWFVEPTIFADVDNAHTIAREEIFGPVLSVIPYEGVEDAVALANDSDYGLAGTIWSQDTDRAESLARRIRTGTIGINHYTADPVAPYGGVKASGLGRELGPEGLDAYQQLQSIYPAPAS